MDGLAGDVAPAGTAQKAHHGRHILGLAALPRDGAVREMVGGICEVAGRVVSMAPGTTQFAVILWAARSCASAREKPTSADFAS